MNRLRRRYMLVIPIALVLAIGLVSGAVAYWTGSGRGTVTAAPAKPQPLSFVPGAPTSQLYPGGAADVAIVATNPNAFVVRVDSLALDLAATEPIQVDGGHPGCAAAALAFIGQSNEGNGWLVPARVGATDGTLAIDLLGSLTMSSEATSACQGATFTVQVEAGP